ncbi:MAG: DUF2155 domain-containing protein [Pseudomonadota bacterium]
MILRPGVILASWAILGTVAIAQDAPQPEQPPGDETQQLEEDFDALFNPEPEPNDNRTPAAPIELGPAPSTTLNSEPIEPALDVRADEDVSADDEDGETANGDKASGEEGEEEEDVRTPLRWNQFETATLRGLDKITGRFTDIDARVGQAVQFGTLRVEVQTCFQTPPDLAPESAAFIRVNSLQPMETQAGLEPEPLLFSGWMFASSPGLNALEHSVYDVWVINCARVEFPVSAEQ